MHLKASFAKWQPFCSNSLCEDRHDIDIKRPTIRRSCIHREIDGTVVLILSHNLHLQWFHVSVTASEIIGNSIVQRKHQRSTLLALCKRNPPTRGPRHAENVSISCQPCRSKNIYVWHSGAGMYMVVCFVLYFILFSIDVWNDSAFSSDSVTNTYIHVICRLISMLYLEWMSYLWLPKM